MAASIAALMFALASAAMIAVDIFLPAWALAGQVVVILAGFGVAGQFFWRRKEYRAKWGERAYRNAFLRHMLPGLPMMFAAIFHTAYMPGERVPLGWATPIAAMLGLYFAATGFVLWARAGEYFGADNGGMLYVYFPDESRMIESAIYGILRHPMYSGAVRVGLALGLWRGTFFSILFGLFMPIGLTLWLRLAEEPELIERFGEAYAEHRRNVPAFWPRAAQWGKFWRFLISGR